LFLSLFGNFLFFGLLSCSKFPWYGFLSIVLLTLQVGLQDPALLNFLFVISPFCISCCSRSFLFFYLLFASKFDVGIFDFGFIFLNFWFWILYCGSVLYHDVFSSLSSLIPRSFCPLRFYGIFFGSIWFVSG
jgi:hypothetical protein